MPIRLRLSSKAKTVYVEHGVWFDSKTKHIHVTIPGAEEIPGAVGGHWSYSRNTDPRRYAFYKAILQSQGRWPEGQE
ncbi:hypothetical protein [Streptosporangium sp. 'caverna']|uniref:hypothetical protein n=1 Tax=Streptosporangium sp. 'caverna' TaxID=2202249 RepID=UPI000D7E3FA1|nr:hypothetical protein [Streptosporangium sp. 'caverna']AWS45004.1 hypothetical protein DKM19_30510 [Streptosporangium sp. 'caverna']